MKKDGQRYTVAQKLEHAWAAGFFDGEGSAYFRTRPTPAGGSQRDMYLAVDQVDRRALDRFASAVGAGRVVGPYKNKGRGAYRWSVRRIDSAKTVYAVLLPYLAPIKRDQISDVLKKWDAYVTKRGECPHGSFYSKCSPCHHASANKSWITRRKDKE